MKRFVNRANILGILVSSLGLIAFALAKPTLFHATQGPLFSFEFPFLERGANQGQEKGFGWSEMGPHPVTAESLAVDQLIRDRTLPGAWSGDDISELSRFILAKSEQYRVSPFLVLSLIDVESHFRPEVVSRRGAVGLMQLLPDTAAEVATSSGLIWHPDLLVDPKANIELGLRYMAVLRRQFGSEEDALTAYNMGPGALLAKQNQGEEISREYFRLVKARMKNFGQRARVSSDRSRHWASLWLDREKRAPERSGLGKPALPAGSCASHSPKQRALPFCPPNQPAPARNHRHASPDRKWEVTSPLSPIYPEPIAWR